MNDVTMPGLIVPPLEARVDKLEKGGLERANRAQRRAAQKMERRAKQSADRMRTTYGRMGTDVGAMFKRMAVPLLAGVASVNTLRSIANTTKGIAAMGDEAKRAGVSLEAFQEWKFVAEQNRVSLDAVIDGFKELNLRADEFIVTGKGPAAEAFTKLGFSAEDLSERLKDPSELLLEIFKRSRRLSTAGRIRVADEIFGGTGGERFVELMARGEDNLRSTIDRAHDLGGLVLEDDVVARADEVSRKFDEMTSRVSTFGKRVAVSIAEGIAEAADLRAALDELFKDEGGQGGRAVLGDEIYDALGSNRDAVDDQSESIKRLNALHSNLSDTARKTAASLQSASLQVRAYGYDDAAAEINNAASEMIRLADEFAEGSITGEELAEKLDEVRTSADRAFAELDDADKVDFSVAVSEVSRLGGVLQTVIGLANSLKTAIAEAAGVTPPAKTPMQVFHEADAESMRNWEAQRQALTDFLNAEAERNSMSRERLALEREIAATIKRAQEDGVTLTRAQAEAAAQAKLEADAARRGSKGGGGGGGDDAFGRAVQSIRDETIALELEAAALLATAAAGDELAASIEAARREAELLHAAQMAGHQITPALRAEIKRLAAGYSDAATAAEQAGERLISFRPRRTRLSL